jgi:hypothetical protein
MLNTAIVHAQPGDCKRIHRAEGPFLTRFSHSLPLHQPVASFSHPSRMRPIALPTARFGQ